MFQRYFIFCSFVLALIFVMGCGGGDSDSGGDSTPTTSDLKIVSPAGAFKILVGEKKDVTASGGDGTYIWSVTGGARIIDKQGSSVTLLGIDIGSFRVTVQSGRDDASLDFTVEPGVNKIKITSLKPVPGAGVTVKFGSPIKVDLHYSAAAGGSIIEVFPSEDGKTKAQNAQPGHRSAQIGEGDQEITFTMRSNHQQDITTCCVIANLIDRDGKILDTVSKKAKYHWTGGGGGR
jgi:hypothetical protein